MKLSCLESVLGGDSLGETFDLAARAGFDGVDLRGDTVGPRIDDVLQQMGRTGIEVPTVYGRVTTPLLSATVAERLQSVELVRSRLRDAAAVGATRLIVVPVFGEARIALDWPGGVEAAELAVLAVLLTELAPAAEEAKVRILLEPLNRRETHLLRSPAATAKLTRRIGSEWVATMADTYHMDLEGQDLAAEVTAAADSLHLVHVSDRDRSLPGEGGIDFAPMIAALHASGYTGYLGWECRGPFPVERLAASVGTIRDQIATATAAAARLS